MTDVSRRSFLRGALTVAAASLVPVSAAKALGLDDVPTLWGDGVHDDTEGLQALIDGKPFEIAGSGFIARDLNDAFELRDGCFTINHGLHIYKASKRGRVYDNWFIAGALFPENETMLTIHPGSESFEIVRCIFMGPRGRTATGLRMFRD